MITSGITCIYGALVCDEYCATSTCLHPAFICQNTCNDNCRYLHNTCNKILKDLGTSFVKIRDVASGRWRDQKIDQIWTKINEHFLRLHAVLNSFQEAASQKIRTLRLGMEHLDSIRPTLQHIREENYDNVKGSGMHKLLEAINNNKYYVNQDAAFSGLKSFEQYINLMTTNMTGLVRDVRRIVGMPPMVGDKGKARKPNPDYKYSLQELDEQVSRNQLNIKIVDEPMISNLFPYFCNEEYISYENKTERNPERQRVKEEMVNGNKEITYNDGTIEIKDTNDKYYRFIDRNYVLMKDLKTHNIDQLLSDGTQLHFDATAGTDVIRLPSGLKIYRFSNQQVEFHYPDKNRKIEVRDPKGQFFKFART